MLLPQRCIMSHDPYDLSLPHVQAALEVRDKRIADELISNILQVSYQGLSARLKKVSNSVSSPTNSVHFFVKPTHFFLQVDV